MVSEIEFVYAEERERKNILTWNFWFQMWFPLSIWVGSDFEGEEITDLSLEQKMALDSASDLQRVFDLR